MDSCRVYNNAFLASLFLQKILDKLLYYLTELTAFVKADILNLLACLSFYLCNKVLDLLEGFFLLLIKPYLIEARIVINKVSNILKLYIIFIMFDNINSDYFKDISLGCLNSLWNLVYCLVNVIIFAIEVVGLYIVNLDISIYISFKDYILTSIKKILMYKYV